jgi:hypothetical protein
MNYVSLVTVVDCRQYLGYDLGGVNLTEVLLLCNFIEQFTSVAQPTLNEKINL